MDDAVMINMLVCKTVLDVKQPAAAQVTASGKVNQQELTSKRIMVATTIERRPIGRVFITGFFNLCNPLLRPQILGRKRMKSDSPKFQPFPAVCGLFLALGAATVSPTNAAPPVEPAAVGPCPVFPANNVWNTPINTLPVDQHSDAYIERIGATTGLHADFGSGTWQGGPIGIPYVEVPGTQPGVSVVFRYREESDPGPYPIPSDAPIEGGSRSRGDRHVLVIDRDHCRLYETWKSYPLRSSSWFAGSGAVFDLNSNALRPTGWTSADAAGLPIVAGLVRQNEVAAGEIRHAIRFTVAQTQAAYVWPARHYASSYTDPALPPMGQRFRLKASFDISGFSAPVQVILRAFQKYGIILADNGSSWYISGAPDERWDNDMLRELGQVRGQDFEAVDASSLIVNQDSGEAKPQ